MGDDGRCWGGKRPWSQRERMMAAVWGDETGGGFDVGCKERVGGVEDASRVPGGG